MRKTWAVAVFAHNEAARIGRAIDALNGCSVDTKLEIYVLANGCTDSTASVARACAGRFAPIHVIEIVAGDKAGAWNHFIHDVRPKAELFFFTDGDCWIHPNALALLARRLEVDPIANAASGAPGCGLDRLKQVDTLISSRGLMGNLYALRGDFVERMRDANVRLPIGLIGEDSLIGALVKWDLDAKTWRDDRIAVESAATFYFGMPSLSTYLRRLIRYSTRRYQLELLRDVIKTKGIPFLPRHIGELYREEKINELRVRLLNALPDLVARYRLRRSR